MKLVKAISFLLLFLTLSVFSLYTAAYADEAEKLWELGEKAYEAKKYNEALSYYQKSLLLCGDNLECKSSNFNGIGRSYEALGDDRKALPYYEDALKIERQRNNKDGIATNLFNIGAIYRETFNQYEKSLVFLKESERLFRELGDKSSLAIVLFHSGKALNSLGKYNDALSYFNESLKLNKESNDKQAVAANLNLIGNVYSKLGQYDKPLAYYREALKINRQLNNQQEIATTLRNIGDAYCDLVESDKAIPYYKEALDIQKKHNLRLDMVITLTNIGAFYKDLNQYDKALSHYEESLKISKELDNPAMMATNLNNIGNVYASLGKSDAALSYYQQALSLEKQLNRPQNTAITLNNIGMEYFRLGQYEPALSYLSEALRIERKLNNLHNIAARLNNIGAVYLRQGRYKKAEMVFLERKDIGKRITKTRLIHAGLIELYLATKKYDEALALLKELPPTWRDNRNRHIEYHVQYGQALKNKGVIHESAQQFLKAVLLVEGIRREVSKRSGFFAGGGYISRLTPHRELVSVLSDIAVKGERVDKDFLTYGKDPASIAFYFSELTKARTLLETMSNAVKEYEEPNIPSEIKSKESYILRELLSIENDWENAYTKGGDVLKNLEQKREKFNKELDSLVLLLTNKFPKYAAINYPRPISAEDLPLMDNEVLLEFSISNDVTSVFVVRKGGVKRVHKINIHKDEIEDKAKKFIEPMVAGRHSEFSIKTARELYDILLSDALKDVKDNEKIIIVPDGILGLLPFEALVIKEGKDYKDSIYVGDRWMITYAQSATVLALTRILEHPQAKKQLFAIGNPVYNKSDPRYTAYKQGEQQTLIAQDFSQYAYRGITVVPKAGAGGDDRKWEEVVFTPLPETEDEIKEIARLFGVKTEPPDVLLNISANETNLRNISLKDYRYIHFATHADLPGKVQGIKEPFIILGQVENKGNDDGFLTLSEVLELSLDADMVVLSACSTGKGRLMEGEGVANFARAFQHAGAKSVLVSLWEVASEPAVEYMKIFYAHLKAGKSRAEALRLARNDIKSKYQNPFYWAVFILHGEG